MQPDYSQLIRHFQDGIVPDAHFYNFFEDSLNQFISANSSGLPPGNIGSAAQKNCFDNTRESKGINTDK
jgi:hypothetical protein